MTTEPTANGDTEDREQPFISHLIELRTRLLRAVTAVGVIFLALLYFANDLYRYLADPLMSRLPEGATMIATEVASPFIAPFKLTFMVALVVAVPYILHEVWAFIAPGLYRHERRLVLPLLVSSTLLFYCGIAFAYFVVFPLVFGFFTSTAPEGVTVMTDISRYLDFVLMMFFAFGLAFEMPVAIFLLVRTGATSVDALVAKRAYVIVGCFIVGMLLTPPDALSQTLLAVPMWLLFEVGVIMARLFAVAEGEESKESESGRPAGQGPA